MSDNRFIVYTTDCPKCKILEIKLKATNIDFDAEHDIQPAIDAGFMSAPVLYDSVENKFYSFADAVKLIKTLTTENE